jgi:hypothetical protein
MASSDKTLLNGEFSVKTLGDAAGIITEPIFDSGW